MTFWIFVSISSRLGDRIVIIRLQYFLVITMMNLLVSSHTFDFRPPRLLLAILFVLAWFGSQRLLSNRVRASASPVLVGGDDEEAAGCAPVLDILNDGALQQMGIRNLRQASTDHRLGFAQAQPDNSTLALGAESKCSNRVLLADISPPGMWPSTDDQDPDPGTVDEFRRRLIANPIGPPAPVVAAKLERWFDLDSILGDGEDRFLRGALTADISYPQLCWPVPLTVEQVKEMGKAVRRAVEAIHEYFSSGFPVVIAILTGDNLSPPSSHHHPPAVRLHQQLEAVQHSSAAAGSHAPAHALGGIRATSGNNDSSRRETGFKEGGSKRRSLLQADNSPPGMWPDADDDDRFSELEMLARRRLMTLGAISRLGVWQVSNDEDGLRRRELLADISPPGMWPHVDDCFPLDRYLEFPDEYPDDL